MPLVAAVVLAGPGWFGAEGRLDPARYPRGLSQTGAAVDAGPGTVLALPWHEYLSLHFADDRRVLNPLPDFLGGDVLVSSDPEIAAAAREQADPREPRAAELVARGRAGRPVGAELATLGVRWVLLLHEVDWRGLSSLAVDPGLRRVVSTPSISLFVVRAWKAPLVTDRGRPVTAHPVIAPPGKTDSPLGRGPALAFPERLK